MKFEGIYIEMAAELTSTLCTLALIYIERSTWAMPMKRHASGYYAVLESLLAAAAGTLAEMALISIAHGRAMTYFANTAPSMKQSMMSMLIFIDC